MGTGHIPMPAITGTAIHSSVALFRLSTPPKPPMKYFQTSVATRAVCNVSKIKTIRMVPFMMSGSPGQEDRYSAAGRVTGVDT